MNAPLIRQIVKNNAAISHAELDLWMFYHDWLPHALVRVGIFPSTSELKRNRPDLWRKAVQGEIITFNWIRLTVFIWR